MFQEFWEVFTDPAHAMAELASSIVIDGLFIFLVYQTLIKKVLLPRLHREYDEEHGIEHVDKSHVKVIQ